MQAFLIKIRTSITPRCLGTASVGTIGYFTTFCWINKVDGKITAQVWIAEIEQGAAVQIYKQNIKDALQA